MLGVQSVMWRFFVNKKGTNVPNARGLSLIQTRGKCMLSVKIFHTSNSGTFLKLSNITYRFRVFTLCSDKTGSIGIIFPDSEVRRITETYVFDIHATYLEVQFLTIHMSN